MQSVIDITDKYNDLFPDINPQKETNTQEPPIPNDILEGVEPKIEQTTKEEPQTKPEKVEPAVNKGEPVIVPKITSEKNVAGKKATQEEVDKIKSRPEAFIIFRDNDNSLTENAQKSKRASENTQLLENSGLLIRNDNNQTIVINKPVFRIGKSPKFSDYVLQGNTAVSRKHAEVITRNGRCFIRDKNSTNGTLIDGNKLPPETEVQIKPGQTLTIANVDFKFDVD